jgi:hypothetical protein
MTWVIGWNSGERSMSVGDDSRPVVEQRGFRPGQPVPRSNCLEAAVYHLASPGVKG